MCSTINLPLLWKLLWGGGFFYSLLCFLLPCSAMSPFDLVTCRSLWCSPQTRWTSLVWPPSILYSPSSKVNLSSLFLPPMFHIIPVWEVQSFRIIVCCALSPPPIPKQSQLCSWHVEISFKFILSLHFLSLVTKVEGFTVLVSLQTAFRPGSAVPALSIPSCMPARLQQGPESCLCS